MVRVLLPVLLMCVACEQQQPTLSSADVGAGVVYGRDSRREPTRRDSPELQMATRASVALIEQENLVRDGSFFRVKGTPLGRKHRLCTSARFFAQTSAALCSGVLIAADQVLTAGHCVETGCEDLRFVFDWRQASGNRLGPEQIYRCLEIVRLNISDEELNDPDMAIVRLDRVVTGRTPIALSADPLQVGEKVSVIGHPSGVPVKISNGSVRSEMNSFYVKAAVDTFGGDSGAPVLGSDGRLKGLLIGGDDDFVFDNRRRCQVVKYCQETGCQGEAVLKLSAVLKQPSAQTPSSQVKDGVEPNRQSVPPETPPL